MPIIDEKLQVCTSFLADVCEGFTEIDRVFERLHAKVGQITETYGGFAEDEDAGESANAQLSQMRILLRDYVGFMNNFAVSVGSLRDDLEQKIEFSHAMIEAIEAGG